MSKYEQLIEYIINEDEAKARELFHSIVVEKSREIYESLIDEQDLDEVGGNEVDSMVDEISADEEGMQEGEDDMDADFDSEDEGGEEDEGGIEMDGGDDEMGGDDMGGEGDIEDRVMDLEDALDELKSEFDALMGQEAGEPEHMGHEMGGAEMGDEMGGAEMGDEMMYEGEEDDEEDDDEEDVEESIQESKKDKKEDMLKSKKDKKKMTEAEWIREYVEKIGSEWPGEQGNPSGKMAGTGNKSEKQGERNTKSVVAGKNDMGGTASNIAKGGAEADPSGTPSKTPGGLLKGGGELIGKIQNRPGGDAGKSSYKTKEGSYESGGDGQGNPTGKMAGTGKNSEKQGERNVKPVLKRIGK